MLLEAEEEGGAAVGGRAISMILPSWEEGMRFLPPWSFLLRDSDGECFFVEKDGRAPEVADTSSSEGPSLSMFTMVVVQGQCLIYSVMVC